MGNEDERKLAGKQRRREGEREKKKALLVKRNVQRLLTCIKICEICKKYMEMWNDRGREQLPSIPFVPLLSLLLQSGLW